MSLTFRLQVVLDARISPRLRMGRRHPFLAPALRASFKPQPGTWVFSPRTVLQTFLSPARTKPFIESQIVLVEKTRLPSFRQAVAHLFHSAIASAPRLVCFL